MSADHIQIFADGSVIGNPGPGGYGVIMMCGPHKKEFSKGFVRSTNNRMELMGVIEALKTIRHRHLPIVITSDSQYVIKAIDKNWVKGWIQEWQTGAEGKKNKDLWMQYAAVAKDLSITAVWVKGHADNEHNNKCDKMANDAARGKDKVHDTGFVESVPKPAKPKKNGKTSGSRASRIHW